MTTAPPPSGTTTDPATTVTRVKPRARGWIHLYSAFIAAAAVVPLVVVAASTRGTAAAVACTLYLVGIVGLFTVSATYHLHTWVSPRTRTWMKRADHSMIFVFIAGSYTPLALLALPMPTRAWVLGIVWTGALAGVALKMLWPHAPRWLGVPIYLAVGWVAIFVLPDLARAGTAILVLICVGGLLYTVGAICYATRRPDPWPRTFGYHEVFHTCVSLAAACHCVAIWLIVLG